MTADRTVSANPTPDDLVRDLAADLALCEAATRGPWDLLDSRVETWHFTAPNGDRPGPGCVEWQILGGQAEGESSDWGWQILGGKAGPHNIHPRREDLLLAAAAREGWPAAIRRALAAEKFKRWVHSYLDAQGVPHHPPGPHGAEGCRIGDRLDWLTGRLREAEAEVLALRGQVEGHCARIAAQSELLTRRAEGG